MAKIILSLSSIESHLELAPIPDYKSNCTFQTDKRSLSFNYAHVVFNKHFHLAAGRRSGSKGAADAACGWGERGPGSGSGCGQGGHPWAGPGPQQTGPMTLLTVYHLASAAGDASACVLSWSHLHPQLPRVLSNWHQWASLGWAGESTGTHTPSSEECTHSPWELASSKP